MILVHHDGTVQHALPGVSTSGMRLRAVTIEPGDIEYHFKHGQDLGMDFGTYLSHYVFVRLVS